VATFLVGFLPSSFFNLWYAIISNFTLLRIITVIEIAGDRSAGETAQKDEDEGVG
jgi:hypothetical protein